MYSLKGRKIKNKISLVLIGILVISIIAFCVYILNYYHAKEYTITGISIKETKNYIIYGNEMSETGLIFYPGAKVEEKAYEPILSELAKKDICCILVKMPFHLAVLNPNAAQNIIKEKTKINQWYIGGHSLGGAMAAEFASKNEEKLEGLILLAAYPTKKLEKIPVLSIYGSEDKVLNKEKYSSSIMLANYITEVIVEGGNHAQFGNYGEQKKDGKAKIAPKKQWEKTEDEILNFIEDIRDK